MATTIIKSKAATGGAAHPARANFVQDYAESAALDETTAQAPRSFTSGTTSGLTLGMDGYRSMTFSIYNPGDSGKTEDVLAQVYVNLAKTPVDWDSSTYAENGWMASGNVQTVVNASRSEALTYVRENASAWRSVCIVLYTASGTAGLVEVEAALKE